jgi:hypothetical protein
MLNQGRRNIMLDQAKYVNTGTMTRDAWCSVTLSNLEWFSQFVD